MSTGKFNLISEPWIPFRTLDGARESAGIVDVLKSSPRIAELCHPSPIVELVLYRLLLAFVYSAYRGPATMREVESIFDGGSFDNSRLDSYAASIAPAFFLLGTARPFMQDPSLASDREARTNVFVLAREVASPAAATLFDHTADNELATLSLAEAAQYLLADQLFGLMDGRGYSPSPLAFGMNVLARGGNLFETLILNMLPYNTREPISSLLEKDTPSWEWEQHGAAGKVPFGWLSYMTRPYRRLLLDEPEGDRIRWVYRRSAESVDKDWLAGLVDPMLSYNVSDESGSLAVRLRADRAVWRDSHGLLALVSRRNRVAPGYTRVVRKLGGSQPSLLVYGVDATNNTIALWRREELPLPFAYLDDESILTDIRDALSCLERASHCLRSAVEEIAKYAFIPDWDSLSVQDRSDKWRTVSKRPSPKRRSKVGDFVESSGAVRNYWGLASQPFTSYITRLPHDRSDAAIQLVRDTRDAVFIALGSAIRAVLGGRYGYRAEVAAKQRIRTDLSKALAPLREQILGSDPEGEL
jgi:CRISPR type I-E-associated protein CasA/Cse1